MCNCTSTYQGGSVYRRAILQFPSAAEAKGVAKELSELLADAQVQQGMGADATEDLNGEYVQENKREFSWMVNPTY